MHRDANLREQIAAEAAEWFARLRGADSDAREELAEWLLRSPVHVEEFLAITRTWGDLQVPSRGATGSASEEKFSVDALVAAARASGDRKNVVMLRARADLTARSAKPGAGARSWFVRRPSMLAASMTCAALLGSLTWWYGLRAPTFATDIGEQRSIMLADGSTVDLNSASRIRVRFSDEERAVDLLAGQGLFRVAKQASRPFVVDSHGARVRALGTAFDVYRRAGATVVTVLEGKVEVDGLAPIDDQSAARNVPLGAGEQATITAGKVARAKLPNVAAATAWTQRRIVFESASLTEVALEFNRYNARQLVVPAGELTDFRVSGVFSSTDPTSFLRFLREQPVLSVEEDGDQIRIVPVKRDNNL